MAPSRLARSLAADEVRLASEFEIADLCPDCEVGAAPPFGVLFDLPTYASPALARDEKITFNAGTHRDAVRISWADFERLVLFAGVCAFCDATVNWMMERDAEGRIRFAPLQGEAAAALRARHPEIPDELDTVVYVERLGGEERVFLRSRAISRVCAELDPRLAWLPWVAWLPACSIALFMKASRFCQT